MTTKQKLATRKARPVRVAPEDAETRKQQIARRLKLSESVLEQYFESKRAEIEDEASEAVVPRLSERTEVREKRI